jgi:hypothetical protein
MSLKRLWDGLSLAHAPMPAKADTRVSSRFSQTI